jgi:GNAT superfamily N-acetyltransferase
LSQRLRAAVSERIVALAELGDPTRAATLAERAFGAGDRAPGWFARKLLREHVDLELSRVVLDGEPDDPQAWLGYVLVGTPPSRAPAARTAGTAVVEAARGRGLGSALLRDAADRCRTRGFAALELWAEHDREGFYAKLGFTAVLRFDTLLAFARGDPELALPAAVPWAAPADLLELHGWLREAWERTPCDARASFRCDEALSHVAREGRAFAIHRTALAPALLAAPTRTAAWFDALLQRLPAPAPVVAIALDRVSSITAELREHGWSVAQRGTVMSLRLSAGQARPRLR